MEKIVLLDYGVGNIGNLTHAFEKLGFEICLTREKEIVRSAELVVLPGVGAFAEAMALLKEQGLDQLLIERARSGKWILGICLGMQLLCESSEEHGFTYGLNLIKGTLKRFDTSVRVPHMGWNTLTTGGYVYFVHSYRLVDYNPCEVAAFTEYDGCVPAIVQKGSVTGFQFHPEKSGTYGQALLKNYLIQIGLREEAS